MVGEVYNVELETLHTLDKLERHPTWYTRDTLNVSLDCSPAALIDCDTYFMRNFRRELPTAETLLTEYRDSQERRYVLPKDRPVDLAVDIKQLSVS